jgi:signal transduction histidine kinase
VPVLLVAGRHGSAADSAEEADGFLGHDPEPCELLSWVRCLLRRKDALSMEVVGRMASGVAHDFNNLLTVILCHADMVCECLPPGGREQEMLAGLRSTAESAAQLAGQMLAVARRQPLTPRLVELDDVVAEVVAALRRVFSARIEIVVRRDGPMPPVRAIPCQLTQVLLNLCLNARDAMPNGGRLTLSTDVVDLDRDTYVRLSVSDTGAGIPADLIPHIFEPYFTTRPSNGTGLGLATVHRVVRDHRGWIECTSEVGRGSTFDVYLPAARAQHAEGA